MHPGYDSKTLENDIALIQLVNTITFYSNNKVAPACLPLPGATYSPGTMVTVSGWGTLYSGKICNDNEYFYLANITHFYIYKVN